MVAANFVCSTEGLPKIKDRCELMSERRSAVIVSFSIPNVRCLDMNSTVMKYS